MTLANGEEHQQHRPLWAPWRIDYVRSPKSDECFLCAKAREEKDDEANLVIARGQTAFVLLNAFPYNSGHLMIAPYRHTADLADLADQERNEIMALIVRAKHVLAEVMHPEGFNIGFNLGKVAGAGLKDHLHGHLVPRWNGDTNFMPVLAGTDVVPEALEETTRLLRDAWTG